MKTRLNVGLSIATATDKARFLNKFSQTRLPNAENHYIIRTSPIIYLKTKAFYGIIVTKSGGKGTKLRRLAIGGATLFLLDFSATSGVMQ